MFKVYFFYKFDKYKLLIYLIAKLVFDFFTPSVLDNNITNTIKNKIQIIVKIFKKIGYLVDYVCNLNY